MNQFSIDYCPAQSAKWLVDRHMKMLLESCQMFCTNFHLQGIDAPYQQTHPKHPTTIWLRTSYDNFLWGLEHAYAIASEYTARYHKRHKSEDVLDWVESNSWRLGFDSEAQTPFALAIAEDAICRTLPEWNDVDEVGKYRLFYKHDKAHLHAWKRNKPEWIE
jgi:hypothetical protein